MDPTKALSESWDKNAENWTKAVREHRIPSRVAGTNQAILDVLREKAPARLLDAGCGEGWLIRRVTEELPCTAVGVDGSAALIASARQADPHNQYHQVTFEALSAGRRPVTGSFDAIVFNFALLHEDVAGPLAAAKRFLAPTGVIIVQTLHPQFQAPGAQAMDGPYRDGWRTETFAGFTEGVWAQMPWFFRTLESWHAVIRDAGLVLMEQREPRPESSEDPLSLLMICGTA